MSEIVEQWVRCDWIEGSQSKYLNERNWNRMKIDNLVEESCPIYRGDIVKIYSSEDNQTDPTPDKDGNYGTYDGKIGEVFTKVYRDNSGDRLYFNPQYLIEVHIYEDQENLQRPYIHSRFLPKELVRLGTKEEAEQYLHEETLPEETLPEEILP